MHFPNNSLLQDTKVVTFISPSVFGGGSKVYQILDVVFAFEVLQNSDFFLQNAELQSLLDYFEETWIGKRHRHGTGRTTGLYSLQSWKVFVATLNGEARTNNSLEGWHRGFSSRLVGEHPNIWRFLNVLKQEQGLTELKVTQLGAGKPPHRSRINYKDCADRLQAKVKSYLGISFKRRHESPVNDHLRLQELLGHVGCSLPPDFSLDEIDAVVLPDIDNTDGELYNTVHEQSINETLLVNYLLGVASNIEYNV
ncbi:unnamed protein product [Allacma fusca]|uniref:Uncharacterized protein n=1 Tax=Allacma fusca TaxID=39272 RepID=A0A8J2K8A9_9HEXA|nr:unnamed protein product [Allacma fusca]